MKSRKLKIIAEPGKPSFTTCRVVDAPRALVFDAFTKPEHLKRWMGPRSLTMVICESDLRVGGRYRFVHRAPDGQEFAFSGVYREIVRPERLVRTFVFELMPEHEALDGHLASGMEAGMKEGYASLDERLAALQTR